jgi:hypothetical protein
MTTVDVTNTRIEITEVPTGTDAGPAFARPFADTPERQQHEQVWANALTDYAALMRRHVDPDHAPDPTTQRWLRVLAEDRLELAGQSAALVTAHRDLAAMQRGWGARPVQIQARPGGGS